MTTVERVLNWNCGTDRLVGVLSTPHEDAADIGVVVVVGGPQYRAGSHRQFTLLARDLAAAGYPVLRFDYRGMGDSEGEARSFEDVSDDIASAVGALQTQAPTVRRVVLWGLCDGASAALLYAHATQDARLAGLCLLNPWVRSAQSLAKAHVKHYYVQRLGQREFWLKLMRGRVAISAPLDLARNIGRATKPTRPAKDRMATFQQRMLGGWHSFRGAVLLILSGNDLTAQEFAQYTRADLQWTQTMALARVTTQEIPDADHTFSSPGSHLEMSQCTLGWLAALAGSGGPCIPCVSIAGKMEVCP